MSSWAAYRHVTSTVGICCVSKTGKDQSKGVVEVEMMEVGKVVMKMMDWAERLECGEVNWVQGVDWA